MKEALGYPQPQPLGAHPQSQGKRDEIVRGMSSLHHPRNMCKVNKFQLICKFPSFPCPTTWNYQLLLLLCGTFLRGSLCVSNFPSHQGNTREARFMPILIGRNFYFTPRPVVSCLVSPSSSLVDCVFSIFPQPQPPNRYIPPSVCRTNESFAISSAAAIYFSSSAILTFPFPLSLPMLRLLTCLRPPSPQETNTAGVFIDTFHFRRLGAMNISFAASLASSG